MYPLQQLVIGVLVAGVHVDDQRDEVDVASGLLGDLIQGGAQPALARMQPGRVDQRQLIAGRRQDSQDAGAGGLRLGADDGDLLPQQPVEERRLAGAGPSNEGHEARAMRHQGTAPASCLELTTWAAFR